MSGCEAPKSCIARRTGRHGMPQTGVFPSLRNAGMRPHRLPLSGAQTRGPFRSRRPRHRNGTSDGGSGAVEKVAWSGGFRYMPNFGSLSCPGRLRDWRTAPSLSALPTRFSCMQTAGVLCFRAGSASETEASFGERPPWGWARTARGFPPGRGARAGCQAGKGTRWGEGKQGMPSGKAVNIKKRRRP